MIYLKADTAVEVLIGPAIAVGDGFTPVTNLVLTSADEAELIKFNGATTLTGAAITNVLAALTSAVDGYYSLELTTGELDTEGPLWLVIQDDSLILPLRHEFMVVNANVYDSMYAVAGTDKLQTDVVEQVGTTVPTPTTAGVPDVNVERWLDTLVTLSGALPDMNVEAMDAASIASGVIAAAELTNIENEIWDALKSAHVVADSFGDFLDDEITSRQPSGNVTVGTIVANAINAASIAAAAMDSKGDWNIGKTGYALTLANWNVGKTGYTAAPTASSIAAASFAAGAIDAAALATDAIQKIADGILPKKNTALSDIPFVMVLTTNHVSPATGLTPVATRSIDGGTSFSATTGTVTEIANGAYSFDASAADMNGAMIIFKFAVATADDTFVAIRTGG